MFADTLCELEFTAIAERLISAVSSMSAMGEATAPVLHISKKPAFRERQAVVADDEVIEHADVDQRERIA